MQAIWRSLKGWRIRRELILLYKPPRWTVEEMLRESLKKVSRLYSSFRAILAPSCAVSWDINIHETMWILISKKWPENWVCHFRSFSLWVILSHPCSVHGVHVKEPTVKHPRVESGSFPPRAFTVDKVISSYNCTLLYDSRVDIVNSRETLEKRSLLGDGEGLSDLCFFLRDQWLKLRTGSASLLDRFSSVQLFVNCEVCGLSTK